MNPLLLRALIAGGILAIGTGVSLLFRGTKKKAKANDPAPADEKHKPGTVIHETHFHNEGGFQAPDKKTIKAEEKDEKKEDKEENKKEDKKQE